MPCSWNGHTLSARYGLGDGVAADARPGLVLSVQDQRRHVDLTQSLHQIEGGEVANDQSELQAALQVVLPDVEGELLGQGPITELAAEGVPKQGSNRGGLAGGERLGGAEHSGTRRVLGALGTLPTPAVSPARGPLWTAWG